ncbi:MAG: MATE family efflux transporter, partial [Bacteroidales bacterium]|nr:MATE family efflux transporter [Bacteroidales bacterium]
MTKASTYSYRNIWKVAYPILISLVMEQMIGLTDTAFLGRVGEIELGASAIAIVYYMVLFMIGFGFSLGAQIIIGRRNGEGRYRETGKIFWIGLYFVLGLSGIIILLSELFSPWLMKFMVSSPAIYEAALSYVRWRLPGMVFAFITAMFRAFYVGTTQTKTLTLNSIVMVLSNIVFNWILIFGKLGCPALGITGAAIGSSLAELVSLIFFTIYTWRKCDRRKYGLDKASGFDASELKGMMPVCSWTMIQNTISISTWFIFFLYIEHLGERALAVSNITRSVSGLIWVVLQAFSATCSTLVSNIIGEGHQEKVMSLVKRILKLSYGIVSVMIILFCLFPEMIARIYTDIPDLINASVPAMVVMCSSYFLNVGGQVFFQAVSGTGSTKT